MQAGKCNYIPYSWMRGINIVKCHTNQRNLHFNKFPVQIPLVLFTKLPKNPKIHANP